MRYLPLTDADRREMLSVIGAKSVVVSDVEPYTVVGGNPARMIRRLEPPLASVLPK